MARCRVPIADFIADCEAYGRPSIDFPVIFCTAGERKHEIAEEYLAANAVSTGVFLVLVARARASVWKVKRAAGGVITSLEKKTDFVNHYSFHIMDPQWGHLTVKMSGHPRSARR